MHSLVAHIAFGLCHQVELYIQVYHSIEVQDTGTAADEDGGTSAFGVIFTIVIIILILCCVGACLKGCIDNTCPPEEEEESCFYKALSVCETFCCYCCFVISVCRGDGDKYYLPRRRRRRRRLVRVVEPPAPQTVVVVQNQQPQPGVVDAQSAAPIATPVATIATPPEQVITAPPQKVPSSQHYRATAPPPDATYAVDNDIEKS